MPTLQPANDVLGCTLTPREYEIATLASAALSNKEIAAKLNVSVRTVTDTATGDRAVYVPDTGIARLAGRVHLTRGQNQLEIVHSTNPRDVGLILPVDKSVSGRAARERKTVIIGDNTSSHLPSLQSQNWDQS